MEHSLEKLTGFQLVKISVPVTKEWSVLWLRMGERPPIWRVAANILNKQSGQPTMGGTPAWGLGVVLTTPHRKNVSCCDTINECSG
jgi:hypothetical protein